MTARKKRKLLPFTLADLLNKPKKGIEWLIENLIPSGSLTVISGDPGSFKTWVLLHTALQVSRGAPLFGTFATRKGNVLIVDEENRENLLQIRFQLLGAHESDRIFLNVLEDFKIDDAGNMDELEAFIEANDISLVIFDSLVRIHNGEENDARQIARVFEGFKRLIKQNVAVIVTHHHRKQPSMGRNSHSSGLRGSTDILAAVDSHLVVEHDGAREMLTISHNKSRDAEAVQPFEVSIKENNGVLLLDYEGLTEKTLLPKEEAKIHILSRLSQHPEGATRSVLEEETALGLGKNAFGEALKELESESKIVPRLGAKGKKIYVLSPNEMLPELDF